MSKRVLVTGAAGFIGFHTAHKLHQRGDYVVGLDSFNAYYDPQLKRARAQLLVNDGIHVQEADICDLDSLQSIIEKKKITHLVHLAAQAGVRYSLQDPQAYIKSNIEGFVNILETCRFNPHLKLTYASSSSVYGLNTKTPFSEVDRTDAQASLYGVTKKTNELLASSYHHLYGIAATGLRFFTVYGPWGRPDMAYFLFSDAIKNGRSIDIYHEGKLMRDFTYIDDIVQGILAAVDLEAAHEVFNLGNHQPVQLEDFISTLEELIGKKAIRNYKEMQLGDVFATHADISYSSEKLGFQPKTQLKEGLSHFVKWHQSYYSQR